MAAPTPAAARRSGFFLTLQKMQSLENIQTLERYGSVAIVLMFLISGVLKIIPNPLRTFDINRTTKAFSRFYLPKNPLLISLIVLAVGIYEVVASGIIIYDVNLDEKHKYRLSSLSKMAVLSLMIFTMLTTVMFYLIPFKMRPFLSNLSTLAGLSFVYQVIIRNIIQNESYITNDKILRANNAIAESLEKMERATGLG